MIKTVDTYDQKSYELAQYFLAEDSHRPDWQERCHKLALAIQQAVEDFFDEPSSDEPPVWP